jgi:hypothetical protein
VLARLGPQRETFLGITGDDSGSVRQWPTGGRWDGRRALLYDVFDLRTGTTAPQAAAASTFAAGTAAAVASQDG